MKTFEEHLRNETRKACLRDTQWRLERDRRRAREAKKMRRILLVAYLIGFLAVLVTAAALAMTGNAEEPQIMEASLVTYEQPIGPEQEDFENEKIEAALVKQGYFREDMPLDYDTQAFLRAACEESGVEFELALAVIWKETTFRNVVGDSGDSLGYMQVQPRWHGARMERLGVTDLMDPFSNFRVGCDYLAELLGKYPMAQALTCYNTGRPGHNQYADDVIGYWEELK